MILTMTGVDSTDNMNPNGHVGVVVSSAIAPYAFVWNTGATTQYVYGLQAGVYKVTVTDANGTVKTGSIGINSPVITSNYLELQAFADKIDCCIADLASDIIRRKEAGEVDCGCDVMKLQMVTRLNSIVRNYIPPGTEVNQAPQSFILMENLEYILQENGSKILMERQ